MIHQSINAETSDFEQKSLYKVGGVAAPLAGIFFRRNIAAETRLVTQQGVPVEVSDWFALLQSNHKVRHAFTNHVVFS